MTAPKDRNATVTVCDKCLRASCFGGKFYCEDYRIARATRRTWKELDRLNREHRSYRMPDVEYLP